MFDLEPVVRSLRIAYYEVRIAIKSVEGLEIKIEVDIQQCQPQCQRQCQRQRAIFAELKSSSSLNFTLKQYSDIMTNTS